MVLSDEQRDEFGRIVVEELEHNSIEHALNYAWARIVLGLEERPARQFAGEESSTIGFGIPTMRTMEGMGTMQDNERIARLEQNAENEREWRRAMLDEMREGFARIESKFDAVNGRIDKLTYFIMGGLTLAAATFAGMLFQILSD